MDYGGNLFIDWVTPLMMACFSGNLKLIASCLNNNMNPFYKDGLGRTAMDYVQGRDDEAGNSAKQLLETAIA